MARTKRVLSLDDDERRILETYFLAFQSSGTSTHPPTREFSSLKEWRISADTDEKADQVLIIATCPIEGRTNTITSNPLPYGEEPFKAAIKERINSSSSSAEANQTNLGAPLNTLATKIFRKYSGNNSGEKASDVIMVDDEEGFLLTPRNVEEFLKNTTRQGLKSKCMARVDLPYLEREVLLKRPLKELEEYLKQHSPFYSRRHVSKSGEGKKEKRRLGDEEYLKLIIERINELAKTDPTCKKGVRVCGLLQNSVFLRRKGMEGYTCRKMHQKRHAELTTIIYSQRSQKNGKAKGSRRNSSAR